MVGIRLQTRLRHLIFLGILGSVVIHQARSQTTPTAASIAGHCWKSESNQTVGTSCPQEVKNTMQLCLNETQGGGVDGTLMIFQTSSLQVASLNPDQLNSCLGDTKAMGVLNIAYDVTASDGPAGTTELTEVRHKCVMGDCGVYLEQTGTKSPKGSASNSSAKAANAGRLLKGRLTMNGQTLRLVRSDGQTNDFVAQGQK